MDEVQLRPVERIDRIIDLLKELVQKYPEKSLGRLIEEIFLLMKNQYINLYLQGNRKRSNYLMAWFHGEDTDSQDYEHKNEETQLNDIEKLMKDVMENVHKREEEERLVHPMLVEDDELEVVMRITLANKT